MLDILVSWATSHAHTLWLDLLFTGGAIFFSMLTGLLLAILGMQILYLLGFEGCKPL